ncbi:MAG: hypothetical protein O8C66_06020 [Candidatus Methanoperedens sp.]|nr:hypothetical protein [Candidatus Methanoperedens sp.]MCZ7370047.1 hypothetical protein [Candidatus Methanoperedens sp.]
MMNAIVTPQLIIFALVFSVFVGVISGVVPAGRRQRRTLWMHCGLNNEYLAIFFPS